MDELKLLNCYVCTLVSSKEVRRVLVAANSYGKAACKCYKAIEKWEDVDSFELTKIQLNDPIFV